MEKTTVQHQNRLRCPSPFAIIRNNGNVCNRLLLGNNKFLFEVIHNSVKSLNRNTQGGRNSQDDKIDCISESVGINASKRRAAKKSFEKRAISIEPSQERRLRTKHRYARGPSYP